MSLSFLCDQEADIREHGRFSELSNQAVYRSLEPRTPKRLHFAPHDLDALVWVRAIPEGVAQTVHLAIELLKVHDATSLLSSARMSAIERRMGLLASRAAP